MNSRGLAEYLTRKAETSYGLRHQAKSKHTCERNLRMSHRNVHRHANVFGEMSDPSQSDNQYQPPANGLYLIDYCRQSGST